MQVIMVLCSIILIIMVGMQSSRNEGAGSAIFGGAGGDNFGAKNRNKTVDGKLAMITKITAVIVMVFAITIVVLDKVLPTVTP